MFLGSKNRKQRAIAYWDRMCGFHIYVAKSKCEFLNPEIETQQHNCQKEKKLKRNLLLQVSIENIIM